MTPGSLIRGRDGGGTWAKARILHVCGPNDAHLPRRATGGLHLGKLWPSSVQRLAVAHRGDLPATL